MRLHTIVVKTPTIMDALLRVLVTTMRMLVGLMDLVSVASQAILVSILLFQEAELFFQLMVFGN